MENKQYKRGRKAIVEAQEEAATLMRQRSRDQILNDLEKRCITYFKTTFVFPIDQMERLFGDLWNQELLASNEDQDPQSLLSEEELEAYRDFEEFRKNVFDNGNKQLRKMINDLRRVFNHE